MRLADVFAERGEPAFRRLERDALCRHAERRGIVMATGAGAVLSASNRRALADNGWVVHLTAPFATLLARTASVRHRPLLNVPNPSDKLRELLAERGPLYRQIAALEVDCDHFGSPDELADHLVARLAEASAPATHE